MQSLRRYGKLLRPYARIYAIGIGLLFATNVLSLLIPRLLKEAIDALSGQLAGPTPFWLRSPAHLGLCLVAAGILLSTCRTGSRVLILGVGRRLGRDLQRRLYRRLLQASPGYFSRFPTGEVMSRCISDVRMMRAVAAPGVLYSFNAVFMFAIAVPYLLSIDAGLTGWLLLPYPFLASGTMLVVTRLRRYAKEAQEAMADLTSRVQEALSGMEVIRAFTLEEIQARRFESTNDVFLDKSMREAIARGVIGIAMVVTGGIGTCVILAVGGARVARGELTYGDLVLFLAVMALVLRPTVYLGWVLSLAQRGLASLDRLDELLDEEVAIATPESPARRGEVRGQIEARSLSYRYPAASEAELRRPALEEVSFSVPPAGMLGLAGRIGSGKSTVLRAVPRLIDIPPGTLHVDGAAVETWHLLDLRRGTGYVPQDGYVFSTSLRENVAFGRPEATEAEILESLRIAELEKDLDQLKDGLDTLVGERGVTLSGGQRQRLAIARAVLIRPRILLLDDALSMVDAETAVAVLKNLHQSLADTTILVAAHRTATLLPCDEIVVLERGRVLERGSPQALLGRDDSQFGSMHERQRLQAELMETA